MNSRIVLKGAISTLTSSLSHSLYIATGAKSPPGTGEQNFLGDNEEEFQFGEVTFELNGAGAETASFSDAHATMSSLPPAHGYAGSYLHLPLPKQA
mgnify:CR=1 FL=1